MMSWSLHWSEVAVLDANAVALGVSEWELMHSAGSQLSDKALSMLEELERSMSPRILVLCGPGNNGGDGYIAAAELSGCAGVEVSIVSSHSEQKSAIAAKARSQAFDANVPGEIWSSVDAPVWSEPDLVIDCLLGVGPTAAGEPLRGVIAGLANWVNECVRASSNPPLVLACDVPTGLGSAACIVADHTLSFHAAKLGMHNDAGNVVAGIGELSIAALPWPEQTIDPGLGDLLRFPALDTEAIKGERGRLLIVGGGPYHGAPLLAAMAAMRVGCDLVHVAMPQAAAARAEWPLDVIVEPIGDEATFSRASISVLEQRMDSGRGVQSVLVGPGLGRSDTTLDAVRGLLESCRRKSIPVVVDADAISALPLGNWPAGLMGVTTPHQTELERWLSETSPATVVDRAARDSNWSSSTPDVENVCIIRTGPEDILHAPFGRICRISRGHPRMSVGGTGDLLAGAVAGLLAGGMSPWTAARSAVWLLRCAGERAGEEFGPGLVAKDVPPYIARVLSKSISSLMERERGG